MRLKELEACVARGETPAVELHAVEQIMYIPFCRSGDKLEPFSDIFNRTLKFPSRYAAIVALAKTGLASLDFVHRSPMGEMIANSGDVNDTELRQSVDLTRFHKT